MRKIATEEIWGSPGSVMRALQKSTHPEVWKEAFGYIENLDDDEEENTFLEGLLRGGEVNHIWEGERVFHVTDYEGSRMSRRSNEQTNGNIGRKGRENQMVFGDE